MEADNLKKLTEFFDRDICQTATQPLRNGVEIAVCVDDSEPVTLTRMKGATKVLESGPKKADLTVNVPNKALEHLCRLETEDVGDLGVEILKLMASSDPEMKIKTRVHVGIFGFLRNGYLGILPLGGKKVMTFLGSKGFSSIGKIREAISNLRS